MCGFVCWWTLRENQSVYTQIHTFLFLWPFLPSFSLSFTLWMVLKANLSFDIREESEVMNTQPRRRMEKWDQTTIERPSFLSLYSLAIFSALQCVNTFILSHFSQRWERWFLLRSLLVVQGRRCMVWCSSTHTHISILFRETDCVFNTKDSWKYPWSCSRRDYSSQSSSCWTWLGAWLFSCLFLYTQLACKQVINGDERHWNENSLWKWLKCIHIPVKWNEWCSITVLLG